MRVENLEPAKLLQEKLRIINARIETVKQAKYIKMYGGNPFEISTKEMKYESENLLQSLRPLFLSALNREKEDILKEIKALD